jgi:hypothetical protein
MTHPLVNYMNSNKENSQKWGKSIETGVIAKKFLDLFFGGQFLYSHHDLLFTYFQQNSTTKI